MEIITFDSVQITDNTIKSAKEYFSEKLMDVFEQPEIDANFFVAIEHYFGITRQQYLLNSDKRLSESDLLKLVYCAKQLKEDKPLAYILGEWEFYGLKFKVNEHTLIPRPETEELVALILEENEEDCKVLDIGTGTGCIPIAIKKQQPNFEVHAIDVSEEALTIAAQNAALNNVEISFEKQDILADDIVIKGLDVIVSNPPYIPMKDKTEMANNVLDYEPHLALFVENNEPLLFYDKIADQAKVALKENGKLYFEIHEKYGKEVKLLMEQKGFKNVEIVNDINGKERMIKALK